MSTYLSSQSTPYLISYLMNGDHSFCFSVSFKQKSGLNDANLGADTLSRSLTLAKIPPYLHVEKNVAYERADEYQFPFTDSYMNLTYLRANLRPIPRNEKALSVNTLESNTLKK